MIEPEKRLKEGGNGYHQAGDIKGAPKSEIRPTGSQAQKAVIEISDLTRRFGDVVAVDRLSLTVKGPGVFGFLGANGAGKTTVIRMIAGLIHPDGGQIKLLGTKAADTGVSVRRKLGYLPQDPAFYSWMSGEEYMIHAGDLFGLSRAESRRRTGRLLESCGLKDAAHRRIGGYSGGMKQRLGIAQALINDPELILLDEPVSALDPVGRAEVLELIEELGKNSTVFMSSHILADVERVCREVAIIDSGKLLIHESTSSLKAKAMRPVLSVEIRGDKEKIEKLFSRENWITEISTEPVPEETDVLRLRLTVSNADDAEIRIPQLISSDNLGLISLSRVMPSLEEVFIALIGKNSSDKAEDSP